MPHNNPPNKLRAKVELVDGMGRVPAVVVGPPTHAAGLCEPACHPSHGGSEDIFFCCRCGAQWSPAIEGTVLAIKLPIVGRPSLVQVSFEGMQNGVGGYVQAVPLGRGLTAPHLYCNEDGMRLRLHPNPHTDHFGDRVNLPPEGAVLGNCYIVRHDTDGELADVRVEDLATFDVKPLEVA